MAAPGQPVLSVYPVTNYSFGRKEAKYEKDSNVAARMERLKDKYAREGLRRSVDAVLVVHEHGHPHVLLLQMGGAFFKLPGGRLRPGEDEVEGLLRKLSSLLAPAAATMRPDWRVGEVVGTYYRPNFEAQMYPYLPPHIARPKEVRRVYAVQLPERCYLAVPRNMKLLAVPLFEMYDNVPRYGPVISAIPSLLSRYALTLATKAPPPPGAGAPAAAAASQAAAAAPPPQQQQQQQQQLVQHGAQQQQAPNGVAGVGGVGGGGITISLAGGAPSHAAPHHQPQQQAAQASRAAEEEEGSMVVDFDE